MKHGDRVKVEFEGFIEETITTRSEGDSRRVENSDGRVYHLPEKWLTVIQPEPVVGEVRRSPSGQLAFKAMKGPPPGMTEIINPWVSVSPFGWVPTTEVADWEVVYRPDQD